MGCRAEHARKQEATARQQVEQALAHAENAEKLAQEQRQLAEEQEALAEERAEKYRNLSYFNSVALADAKYREQNLRSTRKLLESCPEDLRGWEWYRLNHIMDESLITIAPSRIGFGMALSADGMRIASVVNENEIAIWDVESSAKLLTFKESGKDFAGPHPLAFNPDVTRLVSGGWNQTASGESTPIIKVWDTSNGKVLMTLAGHEGRIPVSYTHLTLPTN